MRSFEQPFNRKPKFCFFYQALIGLVLMFPARNMAQMVDLKIVSVGHLGLIVDSETSGLNLYDFGGNPAWLIKDQCQNWFTFLSRTNAMFGGFRRAYEPERLLDFTASFEGVKILDRNQAFWGAAHYHAVNSMHVHRAILRTPYAEHPFRLLDETEGNMEHWGPSIAAQYSRSIIGQRLFWGASLGYYIESGLKNNFPYPRTIDRSFEIGSGLAWQISDHLTLGLLFRYHNIQQFSDVQNMSETEQRTIVITMLRGEKIGVQRFGAFEQFTTCRQFRSLWQLQLKIAALMESAVLIGYQIQTLDMFESSIKPINDGRWRLLGSEIHWKNRIQLHHWPLRLGWSLDHNYSNDWAIHPNFDLLWGDDYHWENRLALGIGYIPRGVPLFCGVEYHYGQIRIEKNDYVSRLYAAGKISRQEWRCGAELGILKHWKIRAGYNYQRYGIDPALLSFSEFLPNHHILGATLGLVWDFPRAEIEWVSHYGQQIVHLKPHSSPRHSLSMMIAAKFYRN